VVKDLEYIRSLRKKTNFEVKRENNILYAIPNFNISKEQLAERIKADADDIFNTGKKGRDYKIPVCLTFLCGFPVEREDTEKNIYFSLAKGSPGCSRIGPGIYFWNIKRLSENLCGVDLYQGLLNEKTRRQYRNY
jgi:hypothetical protein